MKHTTKEWIAATRYWSFAVSVMPVIVTFSYLLSKGIVPAGIKSIICFILAMIGTVILHAAGNVLSDWADFKTGVDNPEAFAVPNLVFHRFEPKEYLTFSCLLFATGIAIGLILTLISGWQLLVIGVAGVALTAAYSFLKYHALGDLDIFVIFSCLIMLGTSFTVTGRIVWEVLYLALPVGIITVSVLHANNTVDIESDSKAGMKSFAMLIGGKASAKLYQFYMMLPFAAIAAAVCRGHLSPLALLCFAAVIPAWKNFKAASHYDQKGKDTLAGLDQASAKLQTIFSGCLSAGLILAAIIG